LITAKKYTVLAISGIILFLCTALFAGNDPMLEKYWNYRERLFNEFIVVSPHVEEFGVNIPATDRVHDSLGNPIVLSWGDGNCNFNHYLGFLATEYRLLKNNQSDYSETFEMLIYALIAIERLDLYSEYVLRKHNNIVHIAGKDTITDFIVYPDDINGFLIRDDVSLGFWLRYSNYFGIKFGWLNKTRDGTNTFMSVFQKGLVPREEMSQDNIVRMLHALAVVKKLVDSEPESMVDINYINDLIPRYLKEKKIIDNGLIDIKRWVDDITNRLMLQLQNPYPDMALTLKPFGGMAKPSKTHFLSIISTRWYLLNKVTGELVAEGSGEDMGVWLNSYGFAEAGNAITESNTYHFDGSNFGADKYLFKSAVFKQFKLVSGAAIPLPKGFDDYMFRDLAVIADVNWNKKSTQLFHSLRYRREKLTYEHQVLILYLLHNEKYRSFYENGSRYRNEDMAFYKELLMAAPANGPSSDKNLPDYNSLWSNSSRLIWPGKAVPNPKYVWEFAGLDYLYLHNLYRLVFEPENFSLSNTRTKQNVEKKYMNRNNTEPGYKAEFFFAAPKINTRSDQNK